jgi:hypothetical protein
MVITVAHCCIATIQVVAVLVAQAPGWSEHDIHVPIATGGKMATGNSTEFTIARRRVNAPTLAVFSGSRIDVAVTTERFFARRADALCGIHTA